MNRLLPTVIGALVLYAAPLWSQVQRWELVPELRIGSMDDPRSTLTWVTGVAVGPNGQVYVAQPQDRTIRIFDSEGEPAGSIGRGGEGPGEFSGLGSIGFLGDTLWVSDGRLQRVSFFDLAGTFLTSIRMASPALDGKFLPTAPRRMLADGTGLVRPGYGAHLVTEGVITRSPLLRIDRGRAILDTVLWLPAGNDQVSIQKGDIMFFTSQPFSDGPLTGHSPAGDVIVVVERTAASDRDSAHFAVTRVNAGGDTVFTKRYRYAPAPLPGEYVDSIVSEKAEGMAKGRVFSNALEAERELRRVLYLPPMRVPITGVVVARDGSIWLKREDRSDDVQVWNVLTAQGAVAATLRTPKRTTVRAIDGSTVWAVERDELDVPYLIRYSVRRVER